MLHLVSNLGLVTLRAGNLPPRLAFFVEPAHSRQQIRGFGSKDRCHERCEHHTSTYQAAVPTSSVREHSRHLEAFFRPATMRTPSSLTEEWCTFCLRKRNGVPSRRYTVGPIIVSCLPFAGGLLCIQHIGPTHSGRHGREHCSSPYCM